MDKNIILIKFKYVLAILVLILFTGKSFGQKKTKVNENYISVYNKLAVQHMEKYKIPASIKLAQGILESNAGKSKLATEGKNHFGIKCHKDWKGETMRANDDLPNECFRKYKKVEDSYEDHSLFLLRARYKDLFTLDITDYKGWAAGLQKLGYATDKAYANKLINLIDLYELYEYDKSGKEIKKEKEKKEKEKEKEKPANVKKEWKHTPYKTGGLIYIIAQKGDTFESLSDEFGFKAKDLSKFNEVPEDFPIQPGDLIYFQKKKAKADKPYFEHEVQIGESMHSISQLYGMRVKSLYKINKLDPEYIPVEGDVLKLR